MNALWTAPRVSVLVADDHPLVRRGIANIIEREPRLSLCAEVDDGAKAATAFRELRPDVVMMDLCMPNADGLEGIQRIRSIDMDARIVVLTGSDSEDDISRSLRAGAVGYLLKDASAEELVTCILRVRAGGRYLASGPAMRLAERSCNNALSPRELDILKLLTTGKSNKDIGRNAGVTEQTVKSHVNNILSKLGVASRTEAVTLAIRRGIVTLG